MNRERLGAEREADGGRVHFPVHDGGEMAAVGGGRVHVTVSARDLEQCFHKRVEGLDLVGDQVCPVHLGARSYRDLGDFYGVPNSVRRVNESTALGAYTYLTADKAGYAKPPFYLA